RNVGQLRSRSQGRFPRPECDHAPGRDTTRTVAIRFDSFGERTRDAPPGSAHGHRANHRYSSSPYARHAGAYGAGPATGATAGIITSTGSNPVNWNNRPSMRENFQDGQWVSIPHAWRPDRCLHGVALQSHNSIWSSRFL